MMKDEMRYVDGNFLFIINDTTMATEAITRDVALLTSVMTCGDLC